MVCTDLGLAYHVDVALHGPSSHPLYRALERAVDHVSKIYNTTAQDDLKSLTESHYGIVIITLGYIDGNYTYRIIFSNKQDYVWFMLRWS